MNRADAELHVRSTPRTCRGPHVKTTVEAVTVIADGLDPDLAAELLTLATPGEVAGRLIALGLNDEAALVDKFARGDGCGGAQRRAATLAKPVDPKYAKPLDFNDIICAGPLDGKPRAYKCPNCGLEGMYQPALYEIEADPA